MGIGRYTCVLAIVGLLALVFVKESLALPPSTITDADCERATVVLNGSIVQQPNEPTAAPKVSTQDLTEFIDESFKDPSLVFCQPFVGCEARAHVLAKRLTDRGAKVRKIFAEGRLLALARDGDYYSWQGHVATLVEITDRVDGQPRTREMVIDPALFDRPVTEEEWKSAILLGLGSKAEFSYGRAGQYDPPSNTFTNSNPNHYEAAAQTTLRALSKLNSLPPDAQEDFRKHMRIDPRLNNTWDTEGFMERWGDPVFRRAWINRDIKPGPGHDRYDHAYWRNWQPPR